MVRVRGDSIDQEVETGRSWRYAGGKQFWGEVSEARAERTAALNARLELAKSLAAGEKVEDRAAWYEKLRELHLEVLTKPGNESRRIELARAQLQFHRDDVAAYHLRRAGVTTEEELEAHQLDKRVMSYISKARSSMPVRQPSASRKTERGTAATAEAADPFQLIRQGSYQTAIDLLAEQARERPTSRVYFGLAKAWAGLEGRGSEEARAWAARALELHATDRKLSHEEQMACRRMRGRSRS